MSIPNSSRNSTTENGHLKNCAATMNWNLIPSGGKFAILELYLPK